jgi:hypothetical protein
MLCIPLLLGCAGLPYSRKAASFDEPGWFVVSEEPGIFIVQFSKNSLSNWGGLRLFTFLRAADVTISQGYKYFTVIDEQFKNYGGNWMHVSCRLKIQCYKDSSQHRVNDALIDAEAFKKKHPISDNSEIDKVEWIPNIDEYYSFEPQGRIVMYDGPKRPSQKIGVLYGVGSPGSVDGRPISGMWKEEHFIRSVDNRPISENWVDNFRIELLPGDHIIGIDYKRILGGTILYSKEPIITQFHVDPGCSYSVRIDLSQERESGFIAFYDYFCRVNIVKI